MLSPNNSTTDSNTKQALVYSNRGCTKQRRKTKPA